MRYRDDTGDQFHHQEWLDSSVMSSYLNDLIYKWDTSRAMVAYTFDPSTWEAEQSDLCEFQASLVHKVSSRTARAVTQRNPVLKKKYVYILFA